MNQQREVLDRGQKADAAEIAAVLRGAPVNADLLCRMITSAYIAGMKAEVKLRALDQAAAGPRV